MSHPLSVESPVSVKSPVSVEAGSSPFLSSAKPSFSGEPPDFLKNALGFLGLLLCLAILSETTGLDIWLEDRFYSETLQAFPWRDSYWLSVVLHDGLRKTMVALLLLLLVAAFFSRGIERYLPFSLPDFLKRKRVAAYLLFALLSGPLIVGLLKGITVQACPWSLAKYGGLSAYTELFYPPFFSINSPGHCFPAAHATVGFALFAFAPLLAPRYRLRFVSCVFLLGMVAGAVQMMRGAHFLSHNLWSAAICWLVMLLAFYLVRPEEVSHV